MGLTIDVKIRFVPNENREHDNAPAFCVMAGESRIGDAGEARSGGETPKNCLRVKLDDPACSTRSVPPCSHRTTVAPLSLFGTGGGPQIHGC
jgi:uncharacterized protein (DUF736 family)